MKKTLFFILFPLLSIGQTQIGSTINGEAAGDLSGSSVSISKDGTTLAIGAFSNDGNGNDSGSVRVYKNISGTWTQIGADIDGEAADDNSGYSVSLSSNGNIVAIGAISNRFSRGSVRVYGNVSGTWTKVGQDIDGEEGNEYSGTSISLSDDGFTLAIGATHNDAGVSFSDTGSVRLYKYASGTWAKFGFDIDGEAADDHFGSSVSLSGDGNIVAIGAPGNDGGGAGGGSVRVYKYVSGTKTQVGQDIDGAAGASSGSSISLSSDGSILAIGAPYSDGNGRTNSGSVVVYKNVSNVWTKVGSSIVGEVAGDLSGSSVSLSSDGSIVAIGAYDHSGFDGVFGTNAGSGTVRVYKNVSGVWTKVGTNIDGEAAGDANGYSVSLSGDGTVVAMGARYGGNSGSVRVYNLSSVLSSDSFVLANFSVFPNPASEAVTISLQEGLTLEKVNVYNTLGQLVKTENKNVISVNSLTKGSYYFEIITNKGKATKTILVQ